MIWLGSHARLWRHNKPTWANGYGPTMPPGGKRSPVTHPWWMRSMPWLHSKVILELGESPKTVQTMLGHSRVAITLDIYSHVSLDLETRAAAKLDAAFEERAK